MNVKEQQTQKDHITVEYLFNSNRERFKLKSLSGEEVGFDNQIRDKNIHRPGLALAGYVELFTYNRVQVVGNTEIRYLDHLTIKKRLQAYSMLMKFDIPCIVITNNNQIDNELLDLSIKNNVPVFQTPLATTKFVYFISDFLDDQFAPQTVIHGSFVDVYGIGVLLMGRSGIGKSEIALDLVERGHRLVADDVVVVTRKGEGILMGAGTDLVKHFMEIRGLGLIDVRSIFGIRSIRYQKRVEVIVEFEDWDKNHEYTRTGLDELTVPILEVELPKVKLPIYPGKNVTVITEVIALNYLLKHYGYDAAKEFQGRLEKAITEKSKLKNRVIDYFEHDFE
jgi:HPr kinase/phosphorylase